MDPDSGIRIIPECIILLHSIPPLLQQCYNWISHNYLFNVFRSNYGLIYLVYLLQFPSFGCFIIYKASLGVGLLVRRGCEEKVFIPKVILCGGGICYF